jgi:large subunit ribosomal protein L35
MGDSRDTIESCVEIVVTMPKLKSRKAAAKRFRRSGSGKIMRRKAFKNHLLQHKNAKQRSRLSKAVVVSEEDAPNVELMLPYL